MCGAGWVGLVGEECGWCLRRYLRQIGDERARLLRPFPDEPVERWTERMAGGIKRGVIRQDEAVRAINAQSE